MKMKLGDWPAAVGRIAVMMIVVCGTIALPALADDVHGAPDRAAALEERINAGDLKYRDSRTGEVVVATAERIAALRSDLAPEFDRPAGATVTVADDGTVRADINGAMRDVYVMRVNLDGTRDFGCFRDLDSAVAFLVGLDRDQTKRVGDPTRTAVNR